MFCRLTESETKTILNIFADHAGGIIDPFGVGLPNRNMHGIRISPKQSPVYQPMVRIVFFVMRNKFVSFSQFMVQL